MNDKPYYKTFEDKKFVARVTRAPYFGNGMAAVSVAINHSYKGVDGTWKNVEPVFEEVLVFDDDNYNFLQDNGKVGVALEVSGRVSFKERPGKDNKPPFLNKSIIVNVENEDHYIRLAAPLEGKFDGNGSGKLTNTKQPVRRRARSLSNDDSDIPF